MRINVLLTALLIVFSISNLPLKGQDNSLNKQLTLLNDNDVYLLMKQDRYYTNGLELSYAQSFGGSSDNSSSFILELAAGHKIFNGVLINRKGSLYWDRPAVGVLYVEGGVSHFLNEKSAISSKLIVSGIGPHAKGEEVQTLIHRVFDMYEVEGWETQLENRLGVDWSIYYLQQLTSNDNKKFELSAKINTTLGKYNQNISVEFPIRLGVLREFSRSTFTKGHLTTSDKPKEWFFHLTPKVMYQAENITVGDVYNERGNLKMSREIVPWVLAFKTGFIYAVKRSVLGISFIVQTQELQDVKYKSHQYGQLSYGFIF